MLSISFFQRSPLLCARELVGFVLRNRKTSGRIIETEAYLGTDEDEACHLFTRPSTRAFATESPAGTAYVYLNYGIHWLTNVLCHDTETGISGFVLIRALEPMDGISLMQKRRKQTAEKALCSGPGKLSQALGIDGSYHGELMTRSPTFCFEEPPSGVAENVETVADTRIGISRCQHLPWRFLAKDHPGVSVPQQRK